MPDLLPITDTEIDNVIKVAPEGVALDPSKTQGRNHRGLIKRFRDYFAQEVLKLTTAIATKLDKGQYSIAGRDFTANGKRVAVAFPEVLELNHKGDFRDVIIGGNVYIPGLTGTPPAPSGVSFTTAPGAPAITTTAITETVSTVNNNGASVSIPGSTLNFSLAAAGKHRYDAIVVNYGTPGYERIAGTEVSSTAAAPTPSIPENRLFVRFLQVTDGAVQTNTPSPTYTDAQAIAANAPALSGKANKVLVINTRTESYTLALTDVDALVRMNVASLNTLTVPPNSAVAFPIGTQIPWSQPGAGQTTFVPGSGVTITPGFGGGLKSAGIGAGGTLIKVSTNGWELHGNITS